LNTAGHPVVLDEIVLAAALLDGLTRGQARYHSRFDVPFFETPFGVRMQKRRSSLMSKRAFRCLGRWRAGAECLYNLCRATTRSRRVPRRGHGSENGRKTMPFLSDVG
jgi:hypothetical protein